MCTPLSDVGDLTNCDAQNLEIAYCEMRLVKRDGDCLMSDNFLN